MAAEPSGMMLWFDPLHEQPRLYESSERGLTEEEECVRLDISSSVSGVDQYVQGDLPWD